MYIYIYVYIYIYMYIYIYIYIYIYVYIYIYIFQQSAGVRCILQYKIPLQGEMCAFRMCLLSRGKVKKNDKTYNKLGLQ